MLDLAVVATMHVAGFASGLAGFAFALIASGVLLLFLPPLVAVPLVLAASAAAQALTIPAMRKSMSWSRLEPFLLGGLIGVPFGTALLRITPVATFRLVLGGFLIAYSLVMLTRRTAFVLPRAGRGADGAVGFVGGLLGGLAGLSGTLPTVWCGLRGWTRDEQRGVYQPYVLAVQLTSLLSIGASVHLSATVLRLLLESLPSVVLGVWMGLRLYRRVDDVWFRRIILGLLLVSGGVLVS